MFTIDECREAIKDKPEFSLKLKDGYWNVDYAVEFETTFVGRNDRETEILLNCRGTSFDMEGNISRLMYKKFFNLNQNPQSSEDQFDFTKPHHIEEKNDGSLCSSILLSDGSDWVLGTRAGVTDVSELATDYLESLASINPVKHKQYIDFITLCGELSFTPMFEFCSRKNRVVIDYPEDKLVLHGVRSMKTGVYQTDLTAFVYPFTLIDLVKEVANDQTSLSDLAKLVSGWSGDQEGVVVKFDDGRYLKIKSIEYCLFHSAVSSIQHEKNLLKIILKNSLDDVYPLLQPDVQVRVTKYAESVNQFIALHESRVKCEFDSAKLKVGDDRKLFAEMAKEVPHYSSALFKMFSGKEYSFRDYAINNCGSSTDVESIRWLVGPSFDLF